MKRRTPLKPGNGFKSQAFSRSERKEAQVVAKLRKCAVKACRKPFVPEKPFVTWCGPDCGSILALDKLAKHKEAKAKAERAADRRRKEEGMSLQDRKEAVQKLINRAAVLRDWHDGCISCDKGPNWNGTWHGSHYKSVGSNSALRYCLWNIHKACSQCNWHRAGNIADYEPRLAIKLGDERLEWLKNHPRSREYSAEYLIRLGAIARKWIKRREKRLGLR